MHAARLVPLCIASVLSSARASADVIVVDDGGGADHTSIQSAVDAAVDGDTILVRAGFYGGFTIANRSLTVTADAGENVVITGAVRVLDLTITQDVLLAGLTGAGVPSLSDDLAGHGLVLRNNFGSVRVETSSFTGADNFDATLPEDCIAFGDNNGFHGALVENCADVVMHRSEFYGGDGLILPDDFTGLGYCGFLLPGGDGGHGVFADAARVVISDSVTVGGDGEYGGQGGRGGDGYRGLGTGQVVVAGTELAGGEGGVGFDFLFGPGGQGGDGILTLGSTDTLLRDNATAGGEGGHSVVFEDGADGQGIEVYGTLTEFSQAARKLSADSPAREGELLSLDFEGVPEDFAVLLYGTPETFLLPIFQGALLTDATPGVIVLGTIDGTGQLSLEATVGGIDASLGAIRLSLQGLFVTSTGTATLGSAQDVVLLDAAF